MTTRPALRLAVAFAIVAASTLGTRASIAAAEAVPFELVPADVTTPAAGTAASSRDDWTLTEAITLEQLHADWLVRDAQHRADIAAHQAELARIAREQEEAWAWRILGVDDQIQRRTGRYLPWPTVAWIIEASDRHGVDPVLVGKIGACESGGRGDAYNPSGASGFGQHLAQYWPARAAGAGYPGASPFDLWVNIEVTAWYLARAGTPPWYPSRHCWG